MARSRSAATAESTEAEDTGPSVDVSELPKGEGPDRAPSEVFNGPAHELNLGVNQSTFVNDLKKRELEEAFPDRYVFVKIEHHGTLNPIEGDHEVAWEAWNKADQQPAVPPDEVQPLRADGLPSASDDAMMSGEAEEGLKSGKTGVTEQPDA